jgi:hypothetical protein
MGTVRDLTDIRPTFGFQHPTKQNNAQWFEKAETGTASLRCKQLRRSGFGGWIESSRDKRSRVLIQRAVFDGEFSGCAHIVPTRNDPDAANLGLLSTEQTGGPRQNYTVEILMPRTRRRSCAIM